MEENSGMLRCIFCGGELRWESDADAYDVSDMYSDEDGGVCGFYTCTRCGRFYEVLDPPREERETRYRDYWNYGEE